MVNGSELICVSVGREAASCARDSGACKSIAPNAVIIRAYAVFPEIVFRKRQPEKVQFMKFLIDEESDFRAESH
jgi:hypothetical protein